MKKVLSIQNIAIVLLIGLLFLQRECSHCPELPVPVNTRTEVWHYDTTYYTTQVAVPYPVEKLVPVEVPVNVDTSAVVDEYFKRNVYRRVLKDDTLAFIALQDTVSKNSLGRSTLTYQNRKPTQIITNTTTIYAKPVNKVFVGPAIGASLDGNILIGASAMLLTKRDHAYQITVEPWDKSLTTSVYWKIKLRKR